MKIKDFAKKSLGQNFLTDDNIKRKIIQACQLSQDDNVLEIGPGLGALTWEIVKIVGSITTVEKDTRLCAQLKDKFKDFPNLKLLNQDFLKFKLNRKFSKVIGNIPYNISSPIIEHLINQKDKINSIYISLQKELAERIIAKPGGKDYGSFSLFVQYHCQPEIKFIIRKGCFRPQPKVDSVFMELKIRKSPKVLVKVEELFFKIIRAAFGQRRKMIANTLRNFIPRDEISHTGLNPNSRPEELSLEDFAKIERLIKK
jgi:16S rRNA (adenine1518-N6/adenine1519-N6)-dimethyltransferase